MEVTFDLVGAAELHRGLLELAQLYERDAKRVLKFGLKKGGTVVAQEMKLRLDAVTRGGSGETSESIGVSVAPKRDLEPDDEVGVVIGASKERSYIARFLEFGTSKLDARPHAAPAFDASAQEALSVFIKQTSRALMRAAKRAGARAPK